MNMEPTLDDLKNSVDLIEYIGQFTVLKKSGKEYSGCCPIHGEKTPSFYVDPDKQLFHCFGCGAGGSVVDFIQQFSQVDTFTAVSQIKAYLGLQEGKKLEPVIRLTKEQEQAEAFISRCEIVTIDRVNGDIPDACASLSDYGIFADTAYSFEGNQVIPLRSKKSAEDVLMLGSRRGNTLNTNRHDGYAIVGSYDEHSRHLYIAIDYIDAVYLHKLTGGNNLIIFSPHFQEAAISVKRDYPNHEIRLITPNTSQGHKILETYLGRYVMPAEEGYFCEKDRKQKLEKVRYEK